jgi:hypothetical protein
MHRACSIAIFFLLFSACGRAQSSTSTPAPFPLIAEVRIVVVDHQLHPIPGAFMRFKWPEDPWDLDQAAGRRGNAAGEIMFDIPFAPPEQFADRFIMKDLLVAIEAPGYTPYTGTVRISHGLQTITIDLTRELP